MFQYSTVEAYEQAADHPRLHLAPRPATFYQRRGKRMFDLVAGSALLIVAAPVVAAIAVVLRITLGPGIVLAQRRVGQHGQDFAMLKFRTMQPCRRLSRLDSYEGPERRATHKSADDPRHTRIGRLLRKTSLDELPQLLQVVTGEMSLVGPRPELGEIVDRFQLRDHPRHAVRPGLTGTWQITQRGAHVPLHRCFDDDLTYLDDQSLRTDLAILARTVEVVVRGTGF